ncbi:50S ribosomal protein L18 [Candidatus Saccharibacteria bacterium]|nr:50S ribosomal protein L18 [Candidatus Saccharibacteria bacterium]
MNRISQKQNANARRQHRVRASLTGSAERPRLSVNISNLHVTAQIIDDVNHKTLAYVSTVGNKKATGTMTEKAALVGAEIAKKAKAVKVTTVAFDRGSKLYHGRVKALAEAARQEGLEF